MVDNSHITDFQYGLSNPLNRLDVKDTIQAPKIGDKVRVLTLEGFRDDERIRLVKELDWMVTVEEVDPIPVGENGDYTYNYTIYTKEFEGLMLLGWEYEMLK